MDNSIEDWSKLFQGLDDKELANEEMLDDIGCEPHNIALAKEKRQRKLPTEWNKYFESKGHPS